LRSVIISQQLLGTREIAVFHHTGCGMLTFKSADLQAKLKEDHPQAASEIEKIDFLAFPHLEDSVKEDVQYLKNHPLVLDESVITGWVYEVESGQVRRINEICPRLCSDLCLD
jgi:carbonic anhydrase